MVKDVAAEWFAKIPVARGGRNAAVDRTPLINDYIDVWGRRPSWDSGRAAPALWTPAACAVF
ncbi:hypothetical protein GFS60_07433 (plasmid) [Rhodococcus sp. WAY2]|nr:hypothetical protein GFS60_07433 [Rhodococcus sp. WAY2]